MSWVRRFAAALVMALGCHGLFLLAVGSMGFMLATGLQHGLGRLPGPYGLGADAVLLLQFPLLHSWLLTRRGRQVLVRLSPVGFGRELVPTTYVALASLQLLLAFWLWTPSGVVWARPGEFGAAAAVWPWLAFGGAWLFLGKALFDAGLGLQSGAIGWWAVLRGQAVRYPDLPTRGLFARCRQPIYLGFALVLWTAPVWSLDWLLLAIVWTIYCIVGPRFKEARFGAVFGARFAKYQAVVPYFLPKLHP